MKTYVYEVYRYAGRILGNERSHLPTSHAVRGYEYTYFIRGKSANYSIVSHDSDISLDAAVQFATAIATQRFKRLTVDLSGCYLKRDDQNNRLWEGKNG